jgi:hypothetical protein
MEMKLRYMIDMILRDGEGHDKGGTPSYEPVGVWIQGPGPGLDIEMFYIDSRDPKVLERKEEANWVINRLVEAGVTSLPEDFLEYHRQTRSPYDGAFSDIAKTDRFGGLELGGQIILDTLSHKK